MRPIIPEKNPRRRVAAFALLALFLFHFAPPARAITINVNFNDGLSEAPAADANGARLKLIMQAAAAYWEDIIEGAGVLTISYYYQSNITGNALFSNGVENGGRIESGVIRFEPTPSYTNPVYVPSNGWYYDATPLNNSEYAMQQVLYRDMTGAAQAAMFNGNPPALLESAFQGAVAPGAPPAAQDAADIWTYALHELGHALGMTVGLSSAVTEVNDNDYDISSAHVNGAVCATLVSNAGGAHVSCTQCLMNTSIGRDNRRLPSAADVLSIAICPVPNWPTIDLFRKDFLPGGSLSWNTAGNWVGNRLPDGADEASVRRGNTISLSGAGVAKSVFVSGGSKVDLNNQKLSAIQTATAEHDGNIVSAGFIIDPGGELETPRLVLNGARLHLLGGLADIGTELFVSDSIMNAQGLVEGYGNIEVDGKLTNNGQIEGNGGALNTLIFNSANATAWDLDGTTGNGWVRTSNGNLNFASGGLSDAFDGRMIVDQSNTLTIAAPWTLGPGGLLQLFGGEINFATLAGGQITALSGEVNSLGRGRVTSSLVLGGSLLLRLDDLAWLELDGPNSINGGTYEIDPNARLRFDGATSISGGTFTFMNGGLVELNGTHSLSGGTFTGLGELAFMGATTINGPVTVSCLIANLDGAGSINKQVTLNNNLTINAGQIDTNDNVFNSTLNINGSSSLLAVNGPASWTMAGGLTIISGTPFTFPSIGGKPFTMSGTASITGGTRWDAQTTISGTIGLQAAGDRLALGSPLPNRLEGGVLLGLGALRAFNTHLSGYGQIGTRIDFVSNASLRAADGVLNLTGAFDNVPPLIGTANGTGTLNVPANWTLPAPNVLELNGGIVSGGTITSQGLTRGHGELRPSRFINNGALTATGGQTLIIASTFPSDLDGVGTIAEVQGHTMNAVEGDIRLAAAMLDAFDGVATVAPGRRLRFLGGWQLGPNGILHLTGNNEASPASIEGTTSFFNGATNATNHVRIATASTFATPSLTTLADVGTVVRLEGNTLIEKGATITGPGTVEVRNGSVLTLADGATLGARLRNRQGDVILGSGVGRATVAGYTQDAPTRLKIDLLGAPGTTNWDQLTVTGAAALNGELEVTFNAAAAQPGDIWKIMGANSITGKFSKLTVVGVPGSMALQKFETADSVYLKLSTAKGYAKWAAENGLPEGVLDGPGDDPDNDTLANAIELFLGGNPLVSDVGLLPTLEVIDVGGVRYLSLNFDLVWHNVPGDLTLHVARSTNLENWSTTEVNLEHSDFSPLTCVETRTYRSIHPFVAGSREFLRLQVEGP